jgi:hypothetical protein
MQTAIIITMPDGEEVLVTIQGVHLNEEDIHAASRRGYISDTWGPPLPKEVRKEN